MTSDDQQPAPKRRRVVRLPMPEEPSCLYPREVEIGQLVLGAERYLWRTHAPLLVRQGLPPIIPAYGGRYWPAVVEYFDRAHRIEPDAAAAISGRLPKASCLFPSEDEIARLVLPKQMIPMWNAIASYSEARGSLPRKDPFFKRRYWRAVVNSHDRMNMVGPAGERAMQELKRRR